jgi:hypothetical protein
MNLPLPFQILPAISRDIRAARGPKRSANSSGISRVTVILNLFGAPRLLSNFIVFEKEFRNRPNLEVRTRPGYWVAARPE